MTTSIDSPHSLSDEPLLTLRSPAEVAEIVPYLLGFHPRASVVLLSMHGPRHRIGCTVRVDLPPDGTEPEFAAYAAARLCCDGAEEAVVAVYPAAGVPPGVAAHRPLVAALEEALEERGITVLDAICVGAERWWSYLCPLSQCCPAEGTPLRPDDTDGVSAVSAAATFAGLTALPDRQALADTLRPVGFLAARAMEQEFERCLWRLGMLDPAGRRPVRGPGVEWTAESLELLRATVDRFVAGRTELSNPEVARLVLGLCDLEVRDTVLSWVSGEEGRGALAVWQELARRSVPPFGAIPLTLVAWSAWHQGGGALANIAVDRATEQAPRYALAVLMRDALACGLDPEQVRRLPFMRPQAGSASEAAASDRAQGKAGGTAGGKAGRGSRRRSEP